MAVVLMLGALATVTAGAVTLLDQPPTQAWGVFSDESFDLTPQPYGYSQVIADDFEVATGGAGFALEEVVVWGAFEPFPGSTFPLWDDVDVLVHADAGGLPGTVLCAESGVSANRQATGLTVTGEDEYMVTLTLRSPCGLSDGSYWIEVYYNTALGYDDWFWEFSAPDPGGIYAYAFQAPGVAWTPENVGSYGDTALQLDGSLGAVACVDSAAALQSALTAAGADGEDDVIQVVQGTYLTTGSAFIYTTAESFDLQLLGGFTAGCTDRVVAPANTILDGAGANPVLVLEPGSSTQGNLHVQGFTISNGVATGTGTAGLVAGGVPGHSGSITIDHNAILNNQAENGAAGILAGYGGVLAVVNNLIAGNVSSGGYGAGVLSCSGETLWMTNNTVADNSCTGGCTGGVEVSGSVPPHINNNILWGNQNLDLALQHSSTRLSNNDIGVFMGDPDPSSTGNLSVDPDFYGGGNYRLQISSPVDNQGTNNPAGGLPAYDLDRRPRARDGHVDMGAYETPPVFSSGFDDPLLGDWTLVVGAD